MQTPPWSPEAGSWAAQQTPGTHAGTQNPFNLLEATQQPPYLLLTRNIHQVIIFKIVADEMITKQNDKMKSGGEAKFTFDIPALTPVSDSSVSSHQHTASVSSASSLLCHEDSPDVSKRTESSVEDEDELFSSAHQSEESVRKASHDRTVHWGTVTQRKYPIIPGDHPDTMIGPPLTIAWEPVSEKTMELAAFEAKREACKNEDDLRLGWMVRRRMLRSLGFSDEEMEVAQKKAQKGRKQRESTVSRLKFQSWAETQEKIVRRLGRTFHPKVNALTTKY